MTAPPISPVKALKKDALGPLELLAQNIALISPTMTAALIVPLMYGTTGAWSWLSYALGTVMLLFVAFNLNQFASRTAGSGSMYQYICKGLGNVVGGLGGWALIWCYLGISDAGLNGVTTFAQTLLGMLHINCPAIVLFVVCIGISGFMAWKNVALSAKVMLVLEAASMAFITVLCLVALHFHGFTVDTTQFALPSLNISTLGLGVVVAVFSLVGFESATAFGDEARNPLKAIPWSVIVSLIIAGVFFVFVTYVEVQATNGTKPTLDQLTAPLNTIAGIVHMPWMAIPISVGAMVSFFALNLSCLNAGSRIIYIMGQQGLFHKFTADSHHINETPHVAVFIMCAFSFGLPTIGLINGMDVGDMFNDAGTLAAFGFIVAYLLVSVSAPFYVKSLGQLKPGHIFISVAALILLLVPTIGSVYPVPPAPVKYFPYMFAAYFIAGGIWIAYQNRRLVIASRGFPEAVQDA
jgi:amino acid transporter